MPENTLPPLLEPTALEPLLDRPDLLVVDLSRADIYGRAHVPGAVHLDYGTLVAGTQPATGKLPATERLNRVLAGVGVSLDRPVVAYDDEGGGKACRLLWTLDVLGHRRTTLLNGGLHAWANEGHTLEQDPVDPEPGDFTGFPGKNAPVAELEDLLERLSDPRLAIVDCRSPEEYSGERRFARKGGHIPGAVHFEWSAAMDPQRNLRLRPEPELRQLFADRGVGPERDVVTYCQTHHRSSHTWYVLKAVLGYPSVKGYPGSWSEWGNRSDTPIEP